MKLKLFLCALSVSLAVMACFAWLAFGYTTWQDAMTAVATFQNESKHAEGRVVLSEAATLASNDEQRQETQLTLAYSYYRELGMGGVQQWRAETLKVLDYPTISDRIKGAVYLYLSTSYAVEGNWLKSKEEAEKGLAIAGITSFDGAELNIKLGDANRELNDKPSALSAYKKAMGFDLSFSTMEEVMKFAEKCDANNQYWLDTATAKTQTDWSGLLAKALLVDKAGNRKQALQLLEQAFELAPDLATEETIANAAAKIQFKDRIRKWQSE